MALDAHRRWLDTHGREGVRIDGPCAPPPADSVLRLGRLSGVDWTDAVLGMADLRWADLSHATLVNIRFNGHAPGVDLRGADLRGADLRGADLTNADLRGADLRGARLFGVRLDGAQTHQLRLDPGALSGVVLEETMRDVQARALASGGLEWIREAVADGLLEVAHLSADGAGPAARFVDAIPDGARPADDPRAALVAAWLAPEPVRAWPVQLDAHAQWVASEGRSGRRLSAPSADLRPHLRDGAVLAWATLRLADLTEVVVDGIDLRGADLRQARLARARLRQVQLSGADCTDADFSGASVQGVAEGVQWTGAICDDAALPGDVARRRSADAGRHGAQLAGAIVDAARLAALDLRGADLSGARLDPAALAGHDLSDARLDSALVGAAHLPRIDGLSAQGAAVANARFADAREADLRGADLRGVIIEGVWRRCDLRGAVLMGADLRAARFIDCDLRGATLHGARLAGAIIERSPVEIHVLAAADLDPIRVACAALPTSLGDRLASDLRLGRPCAWRAVAHPTVHAWLVVLEGPFADLRELTARWIHGEVAG